MARYNVGDRVIVREGLGLVLIVINMDTALVWNYIMGKLLRLLM